MSDVEYCPACNHALQEHTVNEDGELFQLWYCDACEADYQPVGMGEWRMLHDVHGTRPVNTVAVPNEAGSDA